MDTKLTQTQMGDELGSTVLYELREGIARITLNRPDAANAITPDQRRVIIHLLEEADGKSEVRAVILDATGRHFCSGADVRGISSGAGGKRLVGETMRLILNGAQKLVMAVMDCSKPVIAAVQGPAAGLGAHLAFACDLVVAAQNAYFQEPFVLRGITLDSGGAYLLARRIGLQKAKELVFLGDKLEAAEAKALGLVNRVCASADLTREVDALAKRLAEGATVAIGLSKRLLNGALDADRATALLAEAMAQELNSRTEDLQEGVNAFIEKRAPKFRGQ
jgi:2-(1,2-epoxy-1,2-dihydrophenyl)acetyl-CoA isomerase